MRVYIYVNITVPSKGFQLHLDFFVRMTITEYKCYIYWYYIRKTKKIFNTK